MSNEEYFQRPVSAYTLPNTIALEQAKAAVTLHALPGVENANHS
jgi:hypothetical protein